MEFWPSKALSSPSRNILLPLLSLGLIPPGFVSSTQLQLHFNQPHTPWIAGLALRDEYTTDSSSFLDKNSSI